jgi:hypothetical protein
LYFKENVAALLGDIVLKHRRTPSADPAIPDDIRCLRAL